MTAKSRGRWVWVGLVLLSLLAGALSSGGGATAQTLSPTERVDAGVLNALAEGGRSDFIIEMSEQADLSAAYGMTDWDARGQYVVDTLKAAAERTQAPVVAALQKRGADFTSFFAGNVIYVRNGDQKMLEAALAQKGVGRVRAPVTAYITPYSARLAALGPELQDLDSTYGPTWGLIDTRAPEFWDLFGQGEGILVANIDTGVDYDHPLLLPNFRCQADPTDPACFFDPEDECPDDLPCSVYPHGTETMGIMVALDHPEISYTVGMAPGAEWIACLGCSADRNCPETKLLACGDWILEPGGSASNRPHVVNNSWGSKDTNTWYRPTVDAWAAAGIFPVFSAGNDGGYDNGYICDTIGSPADYFNSFAVGAHQESRAIWIDSSKGPGGLGPYTKPNLSAPGVSIVSTVPTTSEDPKTFVSGGLLGTSFAAPHVAGAVALMWSYYPDLHGNVGATVTWLQSRADTPPDG